MKTLLIDNYDSFTFNLFQLIAEVNGEEPVVVRNDGASWSELATWDVDNIVISPGPGRPDRPSDFGVCSDAIRESDIPLLGVCLGHQGIGHVFGAPVVHAPEVMHGRLSPIFHNDSRLFEGIPQGFEVVRYHSLCIPALPAELELLAWTDDGVNMALRHVERPLWGVQFHPESICSEYGMRLLENFRDLTLEVPRGAHRRSPAPPGSIIPRREPECPPKQESDPLTLAVRKLDGPLDPELVFVHLYARDRHAFWLDSSRVNTPQSRFSFMGGSTGPLSAQISYDVTSKEVTVVRGDTTEVHSETIFDYLRRELLRLSGVEDDVPFDFNCGFVGYFGYELKGDCGGSLVHRSSLPDAAFVFADRLIAFDHAEDCTYVLCLTDEAGRCEGERWLDETVQLLGALAVLRRTDDGPGAPRRQHLDFFLNRDRETYLADIERCKQHLAEGETYEVCLTNKIKTDIPIDPLALYRVLRRVNPAPFSAFLRLDEAAVACSSPERFLRIGRDRWVETKPIKGTVRRGATPEEDAFLSEELRTREKNRAENLTITDLVRNDLGIVCEIGSVHVPHLMAIETYETVHQLVSTVRGRLREDLAPADCIRACFPGGSMTGAPKKRTMEIIDDLETEARGIYSGSIGYLGLSGGADLNIVIRTMVLDRNETSIGVGGAVVMQSHTEEEYEETLLKGEAPMQAIRLAVRGQFASAAATRADSFTEAMPKLLEAPRRPWKEKPSPNGEVAPGAAQAR